jgi:hypothetical protein
MIRTILKKRQNGLQMIPKRCIFLMDKEGYDPKKAEEDQLQ